MSDPVDFGPSHAAPGFQNQGSSPYANKNDKTVADPNKPVPMPPVRYLVESIIQPTWASCLPTALLMMVKWKYNYIGGIRSFYPIELENEVYLLPKQIAEIEADPQRGLKSFADLSTYAHQYQLLLQKIDIPFETPFETFAQELKLRGPFCYIAIAPIPRYQHTLVITGVEMVKGSCYLYYNNPDGKSERPIRDRMNFFDFIPRYQPAFVKDEEGKPGMDNAWIISPFQVSVQERK